MFNIQPDLAIVVLKFLKSRHRFQTRDSNIQL